MKKRVLSLALAALMLLSLMPMSAMAASGTYTDGNVTYTLDSGVLTVSGTGACGYEWESNFAVTAVKKVVVKDGVTSIGDYAFADCSSLTSITIPDSVTSIDYGAFSYCSSLTSITIPDGVTSIGARAFYNTAYYNNESNWENGVLYIDNYLIRTKGDLSGDYSIKDGTRLIASSAFNGCRSLESITIPDSVKSIGGSAFYNTAYYNNESNWENGVLYIDNYLIKAKEDLSGDYSIKDGTRLIAGYAFNGCTALESVTIPNSVTSIGYEAFLGCSSLTSITIPNSVTSIGAWAFYSCSSLTSITIPDGVTSIGGWAFAFCSSLTSITIPDSVTSIGSDAFLCCSSLADIYYSGTKGQWNANYSWLDTGATIHYNSKQESTHTHDTELKNAKSATCTEAGYSGDEVCKTCGETVKAGAEIAALGHDYKDGVCTVCGAKDPDYKEPTPAVSFTDVADKAYYAAPVAWAVEKGITGGYPDNTFKPMNTCTRAQIVTFIWRAMGSPEPAGTAKGFNDVFEGTYYYKAVLWAAEQNITGGFNDGGFHPDELVTRAQAMTFLWRAEGKPAVPAGTENTFVDVPETAYYHDAVLWAVANGVTGGYSNAQFGSMDGCTRAQIVTFLYRDMAQ